MPTTTLALPRVRLVAAASMFALAGLAQGQCDIYWPGIPDFDQRRIQRNDPDNPIIITHFGLPNGGGVHCVPTAATNLLAVLDDAGYNVIPNTNHPNWQSQLPLYNTITIQLYELGEYMDTDDGGTNHADAVDGLMDWIEDRGVAGTFIFCAFKADDDQFPRPKKIYNLVKLGWPTCFGYGRYYRDGDELERDGGHAITAVGTLDGCDLNRPQILYHDPNTSKDNESRIEQSPFTRVTRTFYRRFWNMDGDHAAVYAFEETFNGTETDPVRVFDSYRYILPLIALGVHPVNPTILNSFQLPGVFKGTDPQSQEIDSPTAGPIIDCVFNHADVSHLVLAGAGRGGAAGVFLLDIPTRSFQRVDSFDRNPDRVLLDRFGHYYVQLGSVVSKFKLVDDRPFPLGTVTLPNPVSAWAIDDATDTIVALASGNTRLLRMTVDLGLVGNTPIPSGLTLGGEGSIAINPRTGRPWITSIGSPGVHEIAFDPASGRSSVVSTASHSTLRNIRGLSFNRLGQMLVAGDGSVRPFTIDPASGRWIPDTASPWNAFRSMPMGRLTDLSRSRHNESVRNATPGWRDIDPVDEPNDPGVPVCAPDFNLDGFLDFFDYADFVTCYEGAGCPRGRDADYNLDNFVDFFDYTQFVEDFEHGC